MPLTAKQREYHREYKRKWRKNHKNREKEISARYRREHREILRQRSRTQRRTQAQRNRHQMLVRKYGITLEEYNALLKQQRGVCAICKQAARTNRSLAVDHCHRTELVRGLLCSECNLLLGKAQDDPLRLIAALQYIGYQI